ncbi:MAG: GNAT family N-acetyltransferase [Planctomyces sp.]|nr:GNAT family N-acetyltransferase [Planctomyces sp.]
MTPHSDPWPEARETPLSGGRLLLREWSGADLGVGLERWRQLDSRLSDVPLTASWTWATTWLRVYGDLLSARVLTGEVSGRTVAACLVAQGVGQSAGPIPLRTRHVGTAGEPHGHSVVVEYNTVLAEAAHRPVFQEAVAWRCIEELGGDEFRVDGCPAADLDLWGVRQPPTHVRCREAKSFNLEAAREAGGEPLELLGRSTRQNLRRLLRRYGDVETTWASSIDEADEILSELKDLHQARWRQQGQPGAFASARFEAFQRQLVVAGFGEGRVVLYRVRSEGQTVGCLLLLVDRGRLLDYVSGFAPFEEQPSPGLVTHYLCLSEAAGRGYRAYDFLVGDKRHKENLSTQTDLLAWAVWRRPTLRNRVIDVLQFARGLVRRRRTPDVPAPTETLEPASVGAERPASAALATPPV